MKNCFYLLLCLAVFACNESGPSDGTVPADQLESTAAFAASPDQDTAAYYPLYIHKIPAESEINSPVTSQGGFGQVIAPSMQRIEEQMLVKSYWVVEGYADGKASRQQRMAGVGQWIRCFANGTFHGGHWDRQTHAGAWYMDYQGKNPKLMLDSNVDRMDSVWEIQGISGDQASMAMVRAGDTPFGFRWSPVSAKWIELYDMPTKAQFKRPGGL